MKGNDDMKDYTDTDMLVALGTWINTSAGFRARTESGATGEDCAPMGRLLLRDLSVQEMMEADITLRQALLVQPDDLSQVIEETDFAPGAYPLVKAAWGFSL